MYGKLLNGIFACVLVSSSLLIGCASKKPMVLIEPETMTTADVATDTMEPDDIMQTPTASVDDMTPAKTQEAPPDPRIVTMINKFESDLAELRTEQTQIKTDQAQVKEQLTAVNTRLQRVETTLNDRFSNFDAELARIRESIKQVQAPPARTVETPKAAVRQTPERDTEGEVAMAVDSWRQAWQNKDLDTYLRLYDPKAQILRINISKGGKMTEKRYAPTELRQRMGLLFRQYARMEVIVRNFRVTSENNRMVATFEQEFSAWSRPRDPKPTYMDKGVKTLVFVPSGKNWQIISESWTPTE